jgi:hypothetical protein
MLGNHLMASFSPSNRMMHISGERQYRQVIKSFAQE